MWAGRVDLGIKESGEEWTLVGAQMDDFVARNAKIRNEFADMVAVNFLLDKVWKPWRGETYRFSVNGRDEDGGLDLGGVDRAIFYPASILKSCVLCNVSPQQKRIKGAFGRCKRCLVVPYRSKGCQRDNWKFHKALCKRKEVEQA